MSSDVREVVAALAALGPLPTELEAMASGEPLEAWEQLAGQVFKPLSDQEARLLAASFPSDGWDAYGIAWTLVHLLETAPAWRGGSLLHLVPGYWREVVAARLHAADRE